jgi:glycerate dehydrogenase
MMKYSVVVLYTPKEGEEKIYQECFGGLAQVTFIDDRPQNDRIEALEQADVIISRSLSKKEIQPAEISSINKAKFVQLIFAGADNVPFAIIPEEMTVASNPGAFAEPIAEHVLAMALSLAKSLHRKHELLARGEFDQPGFNQFLKGGICGIVGFGGNGKEIAKAMNGIGMKIYAINRHGKTDGFVDFIGAMDQLKKVLEESDVVVLTIPLTRKTRDLIGRTELEWMKRDAILINVARGGIINQKALYEHMEANPDFRVGIDTWWSEPASHGSFNLEYPFFELPNLIGSPHIADHVPGMMPKATKRALENVRNYLFGKEVRGVLKRGDYLI